MNPCVNNGTFSVMESQPRVIALMFDGDIQRFRGRNIHCLNRSPHGRFVVPTMGNLNIGLAGD